MNFNSDIYIRQYTNLKAFAFLRGVCAVTSTLKAFLQRGSLASRLFFGIYPLASSLNMFMPSRTARYNCLAYRPAPVIFLNFLFFQNLKTILINLICLRIKSMHNYSKE